MFTVYRSNSKDQMKDNSFNRVNKFLESSIEDLVSSNEFLEALRQAGEFSEVRCREIAKGVKSAMLQASSVSLIEQKTSGAPEPIASRLKEKDGFSLLLLTVGSVDDSGSRKIIICVDNTQAGIILAKSQLTVLDYERDDIVRAFGENEEVSEEAITSAKIHFENYSVSNAKMRRNFKL